MKKVRPFSLIILLLFSVKLVAQNNQNAEQIELSSDLPAYRNLKKGNLIFSLNGSASNSSRIAEWSLTPQAGYTVANRLVAGLQLSVANRFSKSRHGWMNLKPGGIREYAFTPEVYTRYYVLPFRFTPFVQLSSGYNIGEFAVKNGIPGSNTAISTNNYVMFGALGLSLRTGRNMGLQMQYNLPLVTHSWKNDLIRDNRFRLGLSLYIK